MKHLILILISSFGILPACAQNNYFSCISLLSTPGFETHVAPDLYDACGEAFPSAGIADVNFKWKEHKYKCSNGQGTACPINYHSPDLYANLGGDISPRSGLRVAGMGQYEMIHQKLDNALEANKVYRLGVWTKLMDDQGTIPYDYSDKYLTITLDNNEPKYDELVPPANMTCSQWSATSGYYDLASGSKVQYNFPLNNLPVKTWQNLVMYFEGPSSFNADWISIEVTRLDNNGDRKSINGKSYIILDDLSLSEACEGGCENVTTCLNPYAISQLVNTHNLLEIGGLKGATSASFQLFNSIGQSVTPVITKTCETGLKDKFYWNSFNLVGPLASGGYTIEMTLENGCQTVEFSTQFVILANHIPDPHNPITMGFQCSDEFVGGPLPCCELEKSITISNKVFDKTYPEFYHVRYKITVPDNASVSVTTDEEVDFIAGGNISLGIGFSVDEGSPFHAQILACNDAATKHIINFTGLGYKRGNYPMTTVEGGMIIWEEEDYLLSTQSDDWSEEDYMIDVFPNPTQGGLTLISSRNSSFVLFDLQGRSIMEIETQAHVSQPVSLDALESGIYLLRERGNLNWSRKIVKH